jgi:SAM-dependent methyltransferase
MPEQTLEPTHHRGTADALAARIDALEKHNAELATMVEYLHWWMIRADENIRDVTSKVGGLPEAEADTRGIFEIKWQKLNDNGRSTLENPEHKAVVAETVRRWTGLPEAWFAGKRCLDAGCGDGRLSYGMCEMGAIVTSMDQSAKGVERTVNYCKPFPGHRGIRWNLLERYEAEPASFDLVLSFGVVHCTGDTRKAMANLASLVKPGGYLALMVYGYPRPGKHGDFLHMVRKERVRQAIRHMSGDEAIRYIQQQLDAGAIKGDARGWYDATAPRVEDHYTESQMRMMMAELGFEDITLLDDTIRNIAIRGRKPE